MLIKNSDRIVFAGDSVTDAGRAYPLGEGGDGLGRSYVHIVDNLLAAFYPELRIRVTNAGISGNTSRDLLARFDKDVIALKPDIVSICIGINDVWRQFDSPTIPDHQVMPDEYEKNVAAMLEKLQSGPRDVFLMTPYYMEPNTSDAMRARMDEYGAACRRLSDVYGCHFINLQAMFDRYFTFRHSCSIAWDRVHPNQIGATLIAREFLSACAFDFLHISNP